MYICIGGGQSQAGRGFPPEYTAVAKWRFATLLGGYPQATPWPACRPGFAQHPNWRSPMRVGVVLYRAPAVAGAGQAIHLGKRRAAEGLYKAGCAARDHQAAICPRAYAVAVQCILIGGPAIRGGKNLPKRNPAAEAGIFNLPRHAQNPLQQALAVLPPANKASSAQAARACTTSPSPGPGQKQRPRPRHRFAGRAGLCRPGPPRARSAKAINLRTLGAASRIKSRAPGPRP